ncbi:MAG: NAD(P)-binding domain-containing protein [Paracoccaceae bacterium]|nr:NAD(P)-binding domain-containing protein [Paracoccaceae bacterium]
MTTTDTRRVTVLGLGMMGAALAEALLNAGHDVTVWNRSPEKAEALARKGARIGGSAAEAMAVSDISIICVSNHAATMEILGAADLKPTAGALLVELTTMSPEESREVAGWAVGNGMDYLDGTIFGVPANVTGGSAMVVYSGPRALFDANEALFGAMASPKHLSDEIGSAVSFDRVYYVFGYAISHAFMVGAAIAHAKGFSIDTYTDVVVERSAVLADRLKELGAAISARNHEVTQARMETWAAAFEDALTTCREAGVDDSLPAAIKRNFDCALAAGYGDKEMSAVFEILIDGVGAPSS